MKVVERYKLLVIRKSTRDVINNMINITSTTVYCI